MNNVDRHAGYLCHGDGAVNGLGFSTRRACERMVNGRSLPFCKRLLHDAPGPVFLILDGHPVHRSKAVSAFAASTDGQLRLFRIPSYSPQLNPDEWVWKNIKHDRVGRTSVAGPDQFKALAVKALRRLQRMPHVVRGFFADPDLAYITQAA